MELDRDTIEYIMRQLPIEVVAAFACVSSMWRLAANECLDASHALRPLRTLAHHDLKLRSSDLTPIYLTTTAQGEVCVAESARHRILCFSSSGERRVLGCFGYGPGQLNYPKGIACDNEALYVADRSNHRVQKLLLRDGSFCCSMGGGRGSGHVSGRPGRQGSGRGGKQCGGWGGVWDDRRGGNQCSGLGGGWGRCTGRGGVWRRPGCCPVVIAPPCL